MNDNDVLVTIISYLKKEEADQIQSNLNSLNIKCIVSGHDAASTYDTLYYLVRVKQEDYSRAKQIVDRYRAKIFIDSRKCPKCKSLSYKKIKKSSIWDRIFYVGTTLVQCNKCKHKFGL